MRRTAPPPLRPAVLLASSALLALGAAATSASLAPFPQQTSPGARVDAIRVEGAITPITVEQIERQLARSHADGARALVLVMDTPGGLESAMRSIVQAILASPIPVITYVYPPGARAASAGLFIVTASHVAAMAPSTNLGAASPVSIGGPTDTTLAKKASSDAAALIRGLAESRGRNVDWNVRAVVDAISASAHEADSLNVVDFVAVDLNDVIAQASGMTVTLSGGPLTLELVGAGVNEIAPSLRHRVLSFLADPTIAYLLLMLGFYGLLFELQSPGAILPGVAGAIFIILGFVALQMLPVNIAGILLILLAMGFFVIEVNVQSGGVLATGGVISFFIGSLILFQPGLGRVFRVSLPVVIGTTTATAVFFLFVVAKAMAAQKRRVVTGADSLAGARGEALSDIAPRGQVRVHGEIWQADSAVPIDRGAEIHVVATRGLTLTVAPGPARPPEEER